MRKLLRTSGSIIAVLAGMSAAAAFAQDNAKEAPQPGASQGEIVVTGTLIRNANLESSSPVAVISADWPQQQRPSVVRAGVERL